MSLAGFDPRAQPASRAATDAQVQKLLRISLASWRVAATVTTAEECWHIAADGHATVRVGRAPAGIPFRWLVTTPSGRQRPASSIAGLLRILRSTLDPDWRPGRAQVMPLTAPPAK